MGGSRGLAPLLQAARAAAGVLRLRGAVALLCAFALWAFAPAAAEASFGLLGTFDGSGEGVLSSQVTGIAADGSGHLYVVDGGAASRIEEFSEGGSFVARWGSKGEGAGQMDFPEGIAVASGGPDKGDIYVADSGQRRVDEFAPGPAGTFIRSWGFGVGKAHKDEFEICTESCRAGFPPSSGDEGAFQNPVGVAVDSTSGDVYVSDASGVLPLPIQKFGPGGTFLGSVGVNEHLQGQIGGAFAEPTAMATNPAGDLYVADESNERVQELGPSGEFLRMWGEGVQNGELRPEICVEVTAKECKIGGQGEEIGEFAFLKGAPVNLAIDPSGAVWVPDPGNFRVQEFTSSGLAIITFGWGVLEGEAFETCDGDCRAGIKGITPPQFEDPLGAAAGLSGCPIYVSDGGANNEVDEFGTCGGEPEKGKEKETETEKEKEAPKQPPASGGGETPATTAGASTTTTTTAGIASTPAAIEELSLGCGGRPLVLSDAYIHGSRVLLAGTAAKRFAGEKVKILFDEGRQVATATVLANGSYATTAPLPPAALRTSVNTRYTAEIGSLRSVHLKLTRRLLLEPPRASGHVVTLTGQITLPLTKPVAPVVVEQQLECRHTTIADRFSPPANGRYHITVTVPAAAKVAIFTLKTAVAGNSHSLHHGFTTYSLPLPVLLG